jgi:DNA primase
LGRTVFPVYEGVLCVGVVSRSEKPAGEVRWKVQDGFPVGQFLYDYDAAYIDSRPFVVLVEGPTDLLRVVEAGYPVVASFSANLTAEQAVKLKAMRKKVLVCYDNDNAGRRGGALAVSLLAKNRVDAELRPPPPEYHDVGDMTADAIRRWLNPQREVFA